MWIKAHPFVIVVLICSTLNAQPPFQRTLNAPFVDIYTVRDMIRTTDEGFMVLLAGDSGVVVWKGDINGDPSWSKRISLDGSTGNTHVRTAASTNDGGAIIAFHPRSLQISWDTLLLCYPIVRLDVTGAIVWEKMIYLRSLNSMGTGSGQLHSIHVNSSNEVFLASIYESYHYLTKLDQGGESLWSMAFPVLSTNPSLEDLEPDPFGGCYYTRSGSTNGTEEVLIGRFDGTGNRLWEKRHALSQTAMFRPSGLELASNGDVFIGGTNYGGNDAYMLRTDPDGNLIWFTIYALDPPLAQGIGFGTADLFRVDNDELVLLTSGHPYKHDIMLHVDASGNVLSSDGLTYIHTNDWTYAAIASARDELNGRISSSGYFQQQDEVFGFNYFNLFLWDIELETSGICLNSEDLFQTLTIPPGSFITTLDTLETEVQCWSQDTTYLLTSETPYTTSDFCSLMVTVPEEDLMEPSISVWPNPVGRGEEITLSADRGSMVEIVGPMGQVVHQVILEGSEKRVLMENVSPGLYVVRSLDAMGRAARPVPVIVGQ